MVATAQLFFDFESRPVFAERNSKVASALMKSADGLQKQIDAKRDPGIAHQNPTARRARIAGGMAKEADRLEEIQTVMCALALSNENGDLPLELVGVRSRNVVEMLLTWSNFPRADVPWAEPYRAALIKAGISDEWEFDAATIALERFKAPVVIVPAWQKELKALEQDLIGRKIPGYFPTPPKVIEQMIELAGLEEGMTILEPSAGKGSIADAFARLGHMVHVIEWNSMLRRILELKGYDLVGEDFMEFVGGGYDRVVMNPPFEKGQDMDHVRHAYDVVRKNGLVVAIVSEGSFFRQDKKSVEFRAWLDDLDAGVDKLPGGAFKESERSTGVATRLVVIEK